VLDFIQLYAKFQAKKIRTAVHAACCGRACSEAITPGVGRDFSCKLTTFGEARELYLALSLLQNASRYCIEANLKYTLLLVVAELVPECRMDF
jgi:hypothetical protein